MTNKCRIVVFGKIPPPYIGPAVATQMILESRLSERFEVYHLDTSDHRSIETLGKYDLANIMIALKQYLSLFGLLLRYRPKLIYLLSAQTTIAYLRDIPFILLAKLFRAKVVLHLRGGHFREWYEALGYTMTKVVRFMHAMIDAQIVLGDNLKPMFKDIIPEDRIFVVPNGGDWDFSPRESVDDDITVLYLGNFIPTKGIMEYLRAAEEVALQNKKVRFIAAGTWQDSETKAAMMAVVDRMGGRLEIRENVFGEEKRELLQQSEVFVFPTYYPYEGHPWVIVEAMAAGLPVISTDHAAISQSVEHGINGLLVEKENAQAIVSALNSLIGDRERRERMGKRSVELYEERFTLDHMVDGLSNTFTSVLKETD